MSIVVCIILTIERRKKNKTNSKLLFHYFRMRAIDDTRNKWSQINWQTAKNCFEWKYFQNSDKESIMMKIFQVKSLAKVSIHRKPVWFCWNRMNKKKPHPKNKPTERTRSSECEFYGKPNSNRLVIPCE